jgi:hypothetical protein
VRIQLHPVHPIAKFTIPGYDVNMNYQGIGDFLIFLAAPGVDGLKNEVLQYNGITSINIQKPGLGTILQITFAGREAMLRYLNWEAQPGSPLRDSINIRLKEFFDARDREEERQRSADPVIC